MPEEVFIVLMVFIVFVLAPRGVFMGIKSLRESKPIRTARPTREGEGTSLRRSDLQAMIDDAVIEATAPLVARIDELEREMLVGEGRIAPAVLAEALDDPSEEQEASGRTRQRA